jgi:hypothetical protein
MGQTEFQDVKKIKSKVVTLTLLKVYVNPSTGLMVVKGEA